MSLARVVSFSLLVLVAAAPAQAFRTNTDHDSTVDFSRYQTFAWRAESGARAERLAEHPLAVKRVRGAVELELATKGWRRVHPTEADVFLELDGVVEERVHVHVDHDLHRRYHRPHFHDSHDVWVSRYREGTCTVDIFDAGTGELVWRGWVKGVVKEAAKPEKRKRRIQKGVHQLFKKFPPGSDE